MENDVGPSASSPQSNGLKKVFQKQNRNKNSSPDMDSWDREKGNASFESSVEVGSARNSSPTGIAKLLAGSKRRHRKRMESLQSLAKHMEHEAEDNDSTTGENKPFTPSLQVNGRRRSMSDPGSAPISDDSESEIYPSSTRRSHTTIDPAASSPALSQHEYVADFHRSEDSISNSEHNSDISTKVPRATTSLGLSGRNNASKTSIGSSTSRKLREAFSHRSTNRSPDRGSSKSTGGKSGKIRFGPSRKLSLSSKKAPDTTTLLKTPKSPAKPQPNNNLQPLDTTPKSERSTGDQIALITTLTPPTPTDPRPFDNQPPLANIVNSPELMLKNASTLPADVVVSPSGNMISHRRVRSASAVHKPSNLSNTIAAPQSTIEESKELTGRTPGSQFGSSFFSSMVTAAQNAATTLSNSLNAPPKPRNGSSDNNKEDEAVTGGQHAQDHTADTGAEKKELAVDTLGMGDLDFSHLGIDAASNTKADAEDTAEVNILDQSKPITVSQRDVISSRIEDVRAARAVSMAYENSSSVVPGPEDIKTEHQHYPGAMSTVMSDAAGYHTPPGGSVASETADSLKRAGSLRSKRSGRKRGSSVATNATIGAFGSSALPWNLQARNASVPRLTGFAVANKKRNRDFHQLFRSVPEDDYLIEDYSCALQREIILAGRIYISEGHICFSSNILGWVTTLVIGFDEIIAIEKESTAMVFPNAIAIQSLHARHTFRSLLSRDASYDLMVNIWKISHPTLKSSVNGTHIAQGTGDKTEKDGDNFEDGSSISDEDDIIYDEDEEGVAGNDAANENGSVASSGRSQPINKASTSPASGIASSRPVEEAKAADKAADPNGEFPGPKTHAPTEFTDPSGRYDRLVKDEMIPAPLGQVYSLVFGPASTSFMPKYLVNHQRVSDLQFDDKKGLSNENKTRSYNYIKPLNGSIGPKQTRCISSEQLDILDLEKAVLVTLTTQTPDVPSGGVFAVKTKYLLTWGPNNSTRFVMSCTIEWTGKSWIKGPIEKGANDGQSGFGTELVKALKAGVSRPSVTKNGVKTKNKRTRKGIDNGSAAEKSATSLDVLQGEAANTGFLSFLPGPLGSILSPLGSLFNSRVAIGILFVLLFMNWYRVPTQPQRPSIDYLSSSSQHMVTYEELWQREENELWAWLEERVGLKGNAYPVVDPQHTRRPKETESSSYRDGEERDFEHRLDREKMSTREVEDAIRITKQRLQTLQKVVEKQKRNRNEKVATEQSASSPSSSSRTLVDN
ncbi:hypothetical protein FQN57_002437 [Myotisia sp. PD_48]|nr:hypothetical protein FQN57_002437 [Myotisia sp. PD_48]